MDGHGPKILTRPLPARPSLLSRISPPVHRHHRRTTWILVAGAAAVAVVLYLLIAFFSSPSPQFGIVIDAGSSGTRIHVFGFKADSGTVPSIDWGSTAVMRVTPGLSAYSGEPERAGASLADLLEFAKGRSKARARSGLMRVWERGISSSGFGSWSSQLANQLLLPSTLDSSSSSSSSSSPIPVALDLSTILSFLLNFG